MLKIILISALFLMHPGHVSNTCIDLFCNSQAPASIFNSDQNMDWMFDYMFKDALARDVVSVKRVKHTTEMTEQTINLK
jgi:hypothetical protein